MSTAKVVKACIDCRHCGTEGWFFPKKVCRRPMGTHIDYVTGEVRPLKNDRPCRQERVTVVFANHCGEDARFFENRNEAKVITR